MSTTSYNSMTVRRQDQDQKAESKLQDGEGGSSADTGDLSDSPSMICPHGRGKINGDSPEELSGAGDEIAMTMRE